MSEERKFKIISIPDEITLNKNNIYGFEIIPSDEFLTKEEYEGIPIRLVSLQKVEQLENIRKEAIDLINKNSQYPTYYLTGNIVKDLLNILNKGSE